jgi:hypothetical protein
VWIDCLAFKYIFHFQNGHAAYPPEFLKTPLSVGTRAGSGLIRRRQGGELERVSGLCLGVADGARRKFEPEGGQEQ